MAAADVVAVEVGYAAKPLLLLPPALWLLLVLLLLLQETLVQSIGSHNAADDATTGRLAAHRE